MTNILLIDDERQFIDNRECLIARSSTLAIEILKTDTVWDEVWFDFSLLRMDSIMDVLFYLEEQFEQGTATQIKLCRVHTSSGSGKRLIEKILSPLGYAIQMENPDEIFYVEKATR